MGKKNTQSTLALSLWFAILLPHSKSYEMGGNVDGEERRDVLTGKDSDLPCRMKPIPKFSGGFFLFFFFHLLPVGAHSIKQRMNTVWCQILYTRRKKEGSIPRPNNALRQGHISQNGWWRPKRPAVNDNSQPQTYMWKITKAFLIGYFPPLDPPPFLCSSSEYIHPFTTAV